MFIGFGYQKGQGKDTFADYLEKYLKQAGYSVRRTSFAEPLYELCYNVYGWAGFLPREAYQIEPELKNKKLETGLTARQTLLNVGEHMREYDPTFWINHVFDSNKEAQFTIITDLRHINEVEAFKAARKKGTEAYMFKVERHKEIDYAANDIDKILDGKDVWDFTIHNYGSLEDLENKAEELSYVIDPMLYSSDERVHEIKLLNL